MYLSKLTYIYNLTPSAMFSLHRITWNSTSICWHILVPLINWNVLLIMPESNSFKNLKVKASVSIINRTDLNHDPYYAAFDCPKINRESASAAPYVLNGELSVERLFDMKMDRQKLSSGPHLCRARAAPAWKGQYFLAAVSPREVGTKTP